MSSLVFDLNETVLILTAFEALLLAMFIGLLPGYRKQSKLFLCMFFACIAGTLISTMFIWNKKVQESFAAELTFLPVLLSLCWMLQGPALYLYLKSLHTIIDIRDKRYLVHLIPPLLVVGIIQWAGIDIYSWLPWNWRGIPADQLQSVLLVWAILKCFPAFYVIACFYTEYKARAAMKDLFSTIDDDSLRLADLVIYGYFVHWLWALLAYLLSGHVSGHTSHMHGVLSNYLTVIFINLVFVFGWKNKRELLKIEFTQQKEFVAKSDLAMATAPVQTRSASIEKANEDQEQVTLDRDNTDSSDLVSPEYIVDPRKIARINSAISERKLHLEGQINLERFAEHVSIRPRELSHILNTVYKVNFFEFINNHRVEEAKRLLSSPDESNDSMLNILYRAGFNSQSAFHRFFKRITGLTPSEYKKLHAPKGKRRRTK